MAKERGESEAQFLRCLLDWQARRQLKGETDAEIATSRISSDLAMTIMKGLCRQLRRHRD
jgi:hypothetical protein